jgi:hypothetical protein
MPPAPSWTGDKDKDVQARLLWENLKPINEFVRVVDQYGNPVPGADVTGYVHLNVNFVYDTVEEHTTKTDSDGLFSFTGLHGKGLGWSVTKAGYEGSPNAVALTGPKTGKQSTAKDRITYVMWKQNPEAMVYRKFRPINLPCDNTPVNVNLLQGKTVPLNGDMVIRFNRTPVQIVRGKPFPWTLTLSMPGGGFIDLGDQPYPYLAPTEGYQETLTITDRDFPNKLEDSVRRSYFFKTASGQYGRLKVNLQTDFQPPPTVFGIDSYLNPSGSRNLEYDRAKDPYWPKLNH